MSFCSQTSRISFSLTGKKLPLCPLHCSEPNFICWSRNRTPQSKGLAAFSFRDRKKLQLGTVSGHTNSWLPSEERTASSSKTKLTCARRVHSRDLNTINNTGFDFVLKSSAAPPYTIAISATETNSPCFVSLRCQKLKLFHSDNKN